MPSPEAASQRRHDAGAGYYYRRELSLRELLPAIGVAVGAGLVAFYVTRLLLQRTPLDVPRAPRLPRGRVLELPSRTRPAPKRAPK